MHYVNFFQSFQPTNANLKTPFVHVEGCGLLSCAAQTGSSGESCDVTVSGECDMSLIVSLQTNYRGVVSAGAKKKGSQTASSLFNPDLVCRCGAAG